jgi:hypothetical protein
MNKSELAKSAFRFVLIIGGEFLGYSLRSVSGCFTDRTHRYWPVAFVGYAINMLVHLRNPRDPRLVRRQ